MAEAITASWLKYASRPLKSSKPPREDWKGRAVVFRKDSSQPTSPRDTLHMGSSKPSPAATSPLVLSRFGAIESISSMKMMAGEFFLGRGCGGPCWGCSGTTPGGSGFAGESLRDRCDSDGFMDSPRTPPPPRNMSAHGGHCGRPRSFLEKPGLSASSKAFRRLLSASPAIFDMISGPLIRKKKAPFRAPKTCEFCRGHKMGWFLVPK